jgi:pyruvate/2-oxoglutarate dehydrogenase complex dihydrolipoamide acyltransferase (E2) component
VAKPAKKTAKRSDGIENAEVVKARPGARLPRVANQVHQLNAQSTDTQSNSGIQTPAPAPAATEQERLDNYRFQIGSKYMMDADTQSPTIFTVKNAYKDSNMEFRKVFSIEMGLEVIDLSALMRDKYEPGFKLVG